MILFSSLVHGQEVRSDLRLLTDRVDEMLGGSRADDLRSTSTLRISTMGQTSRLDHEIKPELHARFALKLGAIETWENDAKQWITDRTRKVIHASPRSEAEFAPGTTTKESAIKNSWRFTFEPHFRMKHRPQVSAAARVRREFEWTKWNHSFATNVSWANEPLWTSGVELTSSTRLSGDVRFAFVNETEWAISREHVTTTHGPEVAALFGESQAATLSATFTASDASGPWYAEAYTLRSTYRRSNERQWFFFSVSPFLSYARIHHFSGDPGVSASFEIVL